MMVRRRVRVIRLQSPEATHDLLSCLVTFYLTSVGLLHWRWCSEKHFIDVQNVIINFWLCPPLLITQSWIFHAKDVIWPRGDIFLPIKKFSSLTRLPRLSIFVAFRDNMRHSIESMKKWTLTTLVKIHKRFIEFFLCVHKNHIFVHMRMLERQQKKKSAAGSRESSSSPLYKSRVKLSHSVGEFEKVLFPLH